MKTDTIDRIGLLMSFIARVADTIHFNNSLFSINGVVTADDEMLSMISAIFPLDLTSINEIQSIMDHSQFDRVKEFCSTKNINIEKCLNEYAAYIGTLNKLSTGNDIFPHDAITLSELKS